MNMQEIEMCSSLCKSARANTLTKYVFQTTNGFKNKNFLIIVKIIENIIKITFPLLMDMQGKGVEKRYEK